MLFLFFSVFTISRIIAQKGFLQTHIESSLSSHFVLAKFLSCQKKTFLYYFSSKYLIIAIFTSQFFSSFFLKKAFFPVSSINPIFSRNPNLYFFSSLFCLILMEKLSCNLDCTGKEKRQRSDVKNLPTRSTFEFKLTCFNSSPLKTGFVFLRFLFSMSLATYNTREN